MWSSTVLSMPIQLHVQVETFCLVWQYVFWSSFLQSAGTRTPLLHQRAASWTVQGKGINVPTTAVLFASATAVSVWNLSPATRTMAKLGMLPDTQYHASTAVVVSGIQNNHLDMYKQSLGYVQTITWICTNNHLDMYKQSLGYVQTAVQTRPCHCTAVHACKSGWINWNIEGAAQRNYFRFHLPELYNPNYSISTNSSFFVWEHISLGQLYKN